MEGILLMISCADLFSWANRAVRTNLARNSIMVMEALTDLQWLLYSWQNLPNHKVHVRLIRQYVPSDNRH